MNSLTTLRETDASSLRRASRLIPIVIVSVALSPIVQAVDPPPGGGYPDGNKAVGTEALLDLTTGLNNTALGFRALTDNTQGSLNAAVGSAALKYNRIGSRNTATGGAALYDNSTGNNDTANGWHALQANNGGGNTAAGSGALEDNTTGGNNTALGYESGKNFSIGSNNIDIGNRGIAGESGTIRIGDSDQTRTFIAGIHGAALMGGGTVVVNTFGQLGRAASSERFKEEIQRIGKESESILALRPVIFRYKKEIDPQARLQFGLVAEEVANTIRCGERNVAQRISQGTSQSCGRGIGCRAPGGESKRAGFKNRNAQRTARRSESVR